MNDAPSENEQKKDIAVSIESKRKCANHHKTIIGCISGFIDINQRRRGEKKNKRRSFIVRLLTSEDFVHIIECGSTFIDANNLLVFSVLFRLTVEQLETRRTDFFLLCIVRFEIIALAMYKCINWQTIQAILNEPTKEKKDRLYKASMSERIE